LGTIFYNEYDQVPKNRFEKTVKTVKQLQ